ncbi:MAG: hypothetical protein JXB48_00385 [Candidatus Latescibacteria bacterium]|nr:hypothetical protein [Candidatus Latescibacterota bacterium]
MQNKKNDIISLIDIFSILISNRLLILLITVLGFLISLSFFWFLPKLGIIRTTKPSVIIQAAMKIGNTPEELKSLFELDIPNSLIAELNDLASVADVYRPYMPSDLNFDSGNEYNKFIINNIIRRLNIQFNKESGYFIVSLQSTDEEKTIRFINELLEYAKDIIQSRVSYIINKYENTIEEALDTAVVTYTGMLGNALENAGFSVQESRVMDVILKSVDVFEQLQAISELNYRLNLLRSLKENEYFPWYEETKISVFNPDNPSNKISLVIIITLFAFIISIFLAFIFDYIRSIKKDEESMAKLRQAWHRK